MSLVAYEDSSDEDSNYDSESKEACMDSANFLSVSSHQSEGGNKPIEIPNGHFSDSDDDSNLHANDSQEGSNSTKPHGNGHISDEDDDLSSTEIYPQCLIKKSSLSLPPPKMAGDFNELEDSEECLAPAFEKLPTPKMNTGEHLEQIQEEDDEFLHKKAFPSNNEGLQKPLPPPKIGAGFPKTRVKITIPSLKDFTDVDEELADKAKLNPKSLQAPKGSSLLSMLPTAKSEQDFSKTKNKDRPNTNEAATLQSNIFIPDSVKTKRPAQNTENIDGIQATTKNPQIRAKKPKLSLVECSDSESDNEIDASKDFFSLNSNETLPQVSTNEINSMVAKRAAEMAEAANKFLNNSVTIENNQENHGNAGDLEELCQSPNDHDKLDAEAIHALIGEGNAKRRQGLQRDIQVMDISGEEVMPNREEWMRTTLASSTAYQPTGVLVDEEPASGTRRKHQITYLAHKAKVNEAELQAMWAANRHTRRVTQSKYGF